LSDAPAIAELYLQFWEIHKGIDPLMEHSRKLKFSEVIDLAKKYLKKKKRYHFVAELGSKVVGYIDFTLKENDAHAKYLLYGSLESCVTDKAYRGKGIAKLLTEAMIYFFVSKGVKYIRTESYLANESAVETWKKMGFKPLLYTMNKEL